MSQQILFSSDDQHQQTFENFYPAKNQNVVKLLQESPNSEQQFSCIYLYGMHGSGKTHLLKSAASAAFNESYYIDLELNKGKPFLLPGDEKIKLVVLDNIEFALDQEINLMMTFERLKRNSARLLVSSTPPPRAINFSLEDLASRLLSDKVFEIKQLDDQEKLQALRHRAHIRGLTLTDEVINYMINHYPRDLKTLFDLLDKLDDASLSNQRKLTIPFIKSIQ